MLGCGVVLTLNLTFNVVIILQNNHFQYSEYDNTLCFMTEKTKMFKIDFKVLREVGHEVKCEVLVLCA